jgi:hypothetical protein
MKQDKPDKFSLIEGGREEFESTSEFNNKVDEIEKELTDKYSLILLNERNWVRRLLMRVKLKIEIRKRVQALSSLKNLHAINH